MEKIVEMTKTTGIKGKKDKGSGESFKTLLHLKSENQNSLGLLFTKFITKDLFITAQHLRNVEVSIKRIVDIEKQ